MTKTTNQRRTAGSILEGIRLALADEQQALRETEDKLKFHQVRMSLLERLLQDSEKNGSDDEQ